MSRDGTDNLPTTYYRVTYRVTPMDRPATPTSPRRRGFSFTEVLFAVMILGVGFIMVAAIFPVAIQQSRTTAEETTAAAVARGGANVFEKYATNSSMPATYNVVVSANFDGDGDGKTLARALQGSTLVGADGRYAWVPFYRRAGDPTVPTTWNSFAQVFMIPVLVRNESEYKGAPTIHDNAGQASIVVNIVDGALNGTGSPDLVQFPNAQDRVIPSEGAYLIVANAMKPGNVSWNTYVAPELQGRIYRLGNRVAGNNPDAPPETWELMPGFDFDPIPVDTDPDRKPPTSAAGRTDGKDLIVGARATDLTGIQVFIVGRGVDPNSPGAAGRLNRDGTAQDVAAYTTFVNVK